jgi:hypothetical protein
LMSDFSLGVAGMTNGIIVRATAVVGVGAATGVGSPAGAALASMRGPATSSSAIATNNEITAAIFMAGSSGVSI